jgi:hypothetical protein
LAFQLLFYNVKEFRWDEAALRDTLHNMLAGVPRAGVQLNAVWRNAFLTVQRIEEC